MEDNLPSGLLREARRRAGLSQRRLAIRTGVPQSAIARIESGRVTPRIDTVSKLLRGCGMTLSAEALPGGYGVDRTGIRAMLALTPDERLRVLAASANNLAAFYAEVRSR